jgi:hypothetical protein
VVSPPPHVGKLCRTMGDRGREVRRRKGPDPRRVPVELLFLGYGGFVLLLVGAALRSDNGDVLAKVGLLLTLGSALWFFMRWLITATVRNSGQKGE